MDYNSIINAIESYIAKNSNDYRIWYVGIAKDPDTRLFNDHNVQRNMDAWTYCPADSDAVARQVEKFFIEQRGTDGGPGGGDESSTSVYAYRKQPHTNQ